MWRVMRMVVRVIVCGIVGSRDCAHELLRDGFLIKLLFSTCCHEVRRLIYITCFIAPRISCIGNHCSNIAV